MRSLLAAGVVGLVIVLGDPSEANACTCISKWSLVGTQASEIPSGAPLLFASGCGGSVEPWTVILDGVPAELGTPWADGWVVKVPLGSATSIGADVQVYLDCTVQDDVACEQGDAEILLAHYTVGAADTTAPAPVASLSFTPPQDEAGTECFSVEGKQMIDVSVEIADREPSTWIELVVHVAGEIVDRTTRAIPPSGPLGAVMHVDEGVGDDEICVSVTVHDASGNVSTPAQECVAPAVDAESRGCACGSQPQRGQAVSLFGVLAMLVRRRRR
jgi:hypothetical protein